MFRTAGGQVIESRAKLSRRLGRWVARAIAAEVGGDDALAQATREIRALLVREGVLEG